MATVIREFLPSDYDAAITVWRSASGVVLSGADAREPLCNYLAHNPGLSFVATLDATVVGAVLCGTDGRRGYLHHLAVLAEHRRHSVGRQLVEAALAALRRRGIQKCHLMVLVDNHPARDFWRHMGWTARDDLVLVSRIVSDAASA